MEIFDIVNEKDKVIGEATREECHRNPLLIHRAVHFTLLDKKNKKILLTKRSLQKQTDPGKFCFLGEHVLKGEHFEEALLRGVREELGFRPGKYKETSSKIFAQENQTEFVRFFVCFWENEELHFDKNEVDSIEWVDIVTLIARRPEYSNMTSYWTGVTNWRGYF